MHKPKAVHLAVRVTPPAPSLGINEPLIESRCHNGNAVIWTIYNEEVTCDVCRKRTEEER